jgi:hypothetical protein
MQMKSKFEAQKNPVKGIEFKIDPEHCMAPPLEDHNICQICTFVVSDPQQCGECDSLKCAACIKSWMIKSKECLIAELSLTQPKSTGSSCMRSIKQASNARAATNPISTRKQKLITDYALRLH